MTATFLLGLVWKASDSINYFFKAGLLVLSVSCAFSIFSEISTIGKMPDKDSVSYIPLLIASGFFAITWRMGDSVNTLIKTFFVVACVVLIYGFF
jgi:hypothetical protein